jgi:peptidoglycan hydrolase-like protein with peptidoglycan-binding domain
MALQVVDYSWERPSPQLIRDSGYVGAIRYLSYEASKNLSQWERDALWASGLAVALVWETTARRPESGFGGGQQDAAEANDQADGLGWPGDRPIYYAVDFQTGPGGAVTDYFHGCNSVGRRPVGVYGTYDVIEGLVGGGIVPWGWQCAAWSGDGWGTGGSIGGRRVSTHARLFQHPVTVMGGMCDANDILQDDWGGYLPAPGPEDVGAALRAIEEAKTQVLSQGASGDAVVWAQIFLNKKLGAVVAADGLFGPATTAATRSFQLNLQRYLKDPTIAVDGVVGPVTWFYLTAG